MRISQLNLTNFRNYSRLILKFGPNINIIWGENGSGKTNLVEAIYTLAITKSFRNSNEKNLILKGKEFSKIEAILEKEEQQDKYELLINEEGKNIKINGNKIKLLSEYISKIKVVSFCPNDMKLIKETPSIRRKYLNIEISQQNPEYIHYLAAYNKILKQRNSYLKQLYLNAHIGTEYLDVLTKKMIELGRKIFEYREDFLKKINLKLNDYYLQIANKDQIKIAYLSHFRKNDSEVFAEIKKMYKKEMAFGKTLIGVHLDDIIFKIKENNAKDYASEGQQKSIIISAKLAILDLIIQEKKEKPILILDDLFSELDKTKINHILNLISHDTQTFITTTEISKVKKKIREKSKKILIKEGKVEEN